MKGVGRLLVAIPVSAVGMDIDPLLAMVEAELRQ
jgi:hypothetical protein